MSWLKRHYSVGRFLLVVGVLAILAMGALLVLEQLD